MKLKTIREHQNVYGVDNEKKVGDTYEVADETDAKRLLELGYAEEVPGDLN